jgi:hypothetical protein
MPPPPNAASGHEPHHLERLAMRTHRLFSVLAITAVAAVSCGKRAEQTPGSTSAAPEATPAPRVEAHMLKQWMIGLANRRPGPGATHANTLGYGALGVNVAGNATAWFEMADVDSNGTKEKVGFMWDAANKVMYAYTRDPVTLSDGTLADKGLLTVQYAEGNTLNREIGSGFWAYAVERDSTAAGVTGTLFGCRYNAAGDETECGPGEWSRTGNEFKIKTSGQ